MKYKGPKERVDAARSEETAPEYLANLSRAPEVFVRAAVASNPNTPIDILDSIALQVLGSD